MFSLNRAQIIGNVTRDPEMRYTPNGQAVCSFGVATNRRWRDKDGNQQEQTEFHNVVCWRKVAEIISQYVKKGNRIYVEGHLQTRQWEGQDGSKRNRTEIVMEDFVFLTPKGATASAATPTVNEENAPTSDESESRPDSVGKEFPSSAKATEGKPAPKEEKPAPSKPKKIAGEKKEKTEKAEDEEINLDDIPF